MKKLLGTRVLVKPIQEQAQTKSGLMIPNGNRAIQKAVVEEVGVDCKHLHKGDNVLYSAHAGTDVDVDGEILLIMTEQDVLAVL